MNHRVAAAASIAIAMVVTTICGFMAFQQPMRELEADMATRIARSLAGSDLLVVGTDVYVFPDDGGFFRAVLTPSCSALAAMLAIATLGWLAPRRSATRRLAAVLVACATVFAGNMVRLAGSLAMGAIFGRVGLVAFHDVVGSTLTFVYILGGYILMLRVLLPKEEPGPAGQEPSSDSRELRENELV
jgi:exosortase/archaeosortase family protein